MRMFLILLCKLGWILFLWIMKALCIFFYILPIFICMKYGVHMGTILVSFISIMAGVFLAFALRGDNYD